MASVAQQMSNVVQLVVFVLNEQRFAVILTRVERIVRAAEVTPLPGAPPVVQGILDVRGDVLPVISLRRRFGFPEKEVQPSNQFLIVRAADRSVVLAIDHAEGVVERRADEIVEMGGVAPSLQHIKGLVQLEDGLVLLHDVEKVLSMEEAQLFNEALRG